MIVVFGSINADLVARVARLPRAGETLAGDSFAVVAGGKGANQALAARRAGAEVMLAGATGDDAFRAPALAGLAAAGVDVSRVRTTAAPTGVALIHVDAEGRNAITVIAGANALADPDAVEDATLGERSTLVLQFELPVAAVTALARRARQRGARVLLNAAPAIPLPASLAATLDVLVVNEHEAQVLARETGLPDAPTAFAAAWHRRHGAAVVVTLGAAGVVAAADGRSHMLAAPRVEVVDTTGAGDAFVGTLAAALDRGLGWPGALAAATAAGALACTAFGAQGALPEAARIDALAGQLEVAISPLQDT